jgi:predicted Zn-dependent peptidase
MAQPWQCIPKVESDQDFFCVEPVSEGDFMYEKTMLENGIRVVTETMPEVRSITMGALIEASPQDEIPGQSGLAHFVEHAMFQGTTSRNAMQIARVMDAAGGQMGAFTTRDYTCFTASVLDDYRTYALDLFGDLLLNSIFPADNLEREKEAILREIEASRDVPDERAHSLLKRFVWADHPLGRPIAGRPATVRKLTREDVIYFVHKHYLPNRLIIAAAGNVEHKDFVAQVGDFFWSMMGRSKPSTNGRPAYQAGVTTEHMAVSQVYFSLGIRTYPYTHPNRYAMHILNNLLGSGVSSRLFRRMRGERGRVFDIHSEYHAYRDDGLLVIEGSTAPEYLMGALCTLFSELWGLFTAEEPVGEEELWKAKMHIQGQHLMASENASTRMSRLATQELYYGRFIPGEEILDQIEAIDTYALQRLASELLKDALGQITIAVVGPDMPDYYNASSIEEMVSRFQ